MCQHIFSITRFWVSLLQGGNDHEIFASEKTLGHTGKLSFRFVDGHPDLSPSLHVLLLLAYSSSANNRLSAVHETPCQLKMCSMLLFWQ